jgi:ribosomal protein L11 methyltransferase
MTHHESVVWMKAVGEIPDAYAEEMENALLDVGIGGVQTVNADFTPPDDPNPPAPGISRLEFYLAIDPDAPLDLADESSRIWNEVLEQNGLSSTNFALFIAPLESTDWETRWREWFHPLKIGRRLWISPSWEPADIQEGEIALEMDPGMAFGTGGHETTSLILARLDKLSDEGPMPVRMLDVGTGTGILAIAAAKLGVHRIDAIDNDPEAVEIACENMKRNGVAPQVCSPSETPVEDLRDPYPLVVANIISSVLVELLPHLKRLTNPGGRLWLSGILEGEANEVAEAFVAAGLKATGRVQAGEWVLLEFERDLA